MKDDRYSTTRSLSTEKPECFDRPADGMQTLLQMPKSARKVAEGGLRLQGWYKHATEDLPLITVVTVVYNGVAYLEDTIRSVIEQTYDNVEYIIVDGGSTDGTLDVIRKYEGSIDYWVSESDKGMYDGLAKGFQTVSGSILCYLNAGDLYVNTAMEAVVSIFRDTGVEWITGLRSVCNEGNQVIRVDTPFRYRSRLIRAGVYGKYLPYIQQESTFWSRKLLCQVDMDVFRSLRYAGDYYLWFCFARKARLECAQVQLGIFKRHEGQLSENLDKYRGELRKFVTCASIFDFISVFFESLFWLADERVRRLSRSRKIRFVSANGRAFWTN